MAITLSPAQAGFIKGIIIAVGAAAAAYLSDPSHLTFLSGGIALLIAAFASSVESYLKAESGNTTALYGAVQIR